MQLFTLKPRLLQGKSRPFYEHFEGHIFRNDSLHDDGHILLACVDNPALSFNQFIHVDDLDVIEMTEAEVRQVF